MDDSSLFIYRGQSGYKGGWYQLNGRIRAIFVHHSPISKYKITKEKSCYMKLFLGRGSFSELLFSRFYQTGLINARLGNSRNVFYYLTKTKKKYICFKTVLQTFSPNQTEKIYNSLQFTHVKINYAFIILKTRLYFSPRIFCFLKLVQFRQLELFTLYCWYYH